jgi:hypothetical protein
MKSRLERDPQQMAQCVCSTHYECGRSYIVEIDRPLPVRLPKHSTISKRSSRNVKLAQHTCEGHKACLDEARILEIENNSR